MWGNPLIEAFTGERPDCVLSSEISYLRGRPCCVKGKAIGVNGEFDVASTEARDHRHDRKQSSRKMGDPRNIQLFGVGSVGEGEMPRLDFRWACPSGMREPQWLGLSLP
jgi:hypothetical protein